MSGHVEGLQLPSSLSQPAMQQQQADPKGHSPMQTRASRGLATVRTGHTYPPPAHRTYLRRRAACPGRANCTHAVRASASGVPYVPARRATRPMG